jgi:hypothetical protein
VSIQKKSLLSSLNATKKAIVATSTTEANPSVNAPISARIVGRAKAKVAPHVLGRKTAKVMAKASARA